MLERLTPKAEVAEVVAEEVPAGPPYYLALWDDPTHSEEAQHFRTTVMRALNMSERSQDPREWTFARQAVVSQQVAETAKYDREAGRRELAAMRAELAAEKNAKAEIVRTETMKSALDNAWAEIGAVDQDVKDILNVAVRSGIERGMDPQVAVDQVFKSPLSKLLPKKSAVAVTQATQRKQTTPAQAKLERAAALSGRAGARATPKQATSLTAQLSDFESGLYR